MKLRAIIEIDYDDNNIESPQKTESILRQSLKDVLEREILDEYDSYTLETENAEEHIHFGWSINDVISAAEEDDIELNDKETKKVLAIIKHRYNAELGVNWDVLKSTIAEVLRD